MSTVAIVGTCDTKGNEFSFVRDKILSRGEVSKALLIDVGIRSDQDTILKGDITSIEVVKASGYDYDKFKTLQKSEALHAMSSGLEYILLDLHAKGMLHGVFGMGGGCGTALLSTAFQKLPIGLPKFLLSTVIATGSARAYINCSDITIMYSVADFSGNINRINEQIITNAALGIAAMTVGYAAIQAERLVSNGIMRTIPKNKPLVALSEFGLTQPFVVAAQAYLQKLGYEIVGFHCSGK